MAEALAILMLLLGMAVVAFGVIGLLYTLDKD